MKDFHDGDAGNAKEIGGVSGEEAGLDQSDDLKDESDGRAGNADVEASIKEVVLVFQKAEFEVGIAWAFFDLVNASQADSVNGNLQAKKNGQGDEVSWVHSVSFR